MQNGNERDCWYNPPMRTQRLMRSVSYVLILGSLAMAYLAWQAYNKTSIVVEWSTSSELDVAGFNLYRSESPAGPFDKINEELIPSAEDPLAGDDYSYTDPDVDPGTLYYYNLEEIELSGLASLHGPIIVEARRGGYLEGLIAAWMLIGGVWSWIAARKSTRQDEQPVQPA